MKMIFLGKKYISTIFLLMHRFLNTISLGRDQAKGMIDGEKGWKVKGIRY
jgi:hypothetical protein